MSFAPVDTRGKNGRSKGHCQQKVNRDPGPDGAGPEAVARTTIRDVVASDVWSLRPYTEFDVRHSTVTYIYGLPQLRWRRTPVYLE